MNTDLLDLGRTSYSFEWEDNFREILDGRGLIDRRCKKPDTIVASILKNAGIDYE